MKNVRTSFCGLFVDHGSRRAPGRGCSCATPFSLVPPRDAAADGAADSLPSPPLGLDFLAVTEGVGPSSNKAPSVRLEGKVIELLRMEEAQAAAAASRSASLPGAVAGPGSVRRDAVETASSLREGAASAFQWKPRRTNPPPGHSSSAGRHSQRSIGEGFWVGRERTVLLQSSGGTVVCVEQGLGANEEVLLSRE